MKTKPYSYSHVPIATQDANHAHWFDNGLPCFGCRARGKTTSRNGWFPILDNLTGHHTLELVHWLIDHGVMPLYTPLGGSWLNLAESIQAILKPRALDGMYPHSPEEIIDCIEAAARGWNRHPTPFHWGGKRKARRDRPRACRHELKGSGGYTRRAIRLRKAA